MNILNSYKYCPLCSGNLISKINFLSCSKCGFNIYINPLPCCGVIIENKKGEIMLVERKYEPKKGEWDLPGGFIDDNENVEESVKREIKEELGVECSMKNIIGNYKDVYEYQNIIRSTLTFVVSAKVGEEYFTTSDDISAYKFFEKDVVLKQKIAFECVKTGLQDYLKRS